MDINLPPHLKKRITRRRTFGSQHDGGGKFAFPPTAPSTSLSSSISTVVYQALGTRNGG